MKKVVRIFLIFIFYLLIFSISKTVQANSIDKISMDIYVDNNGNTTINETWYCTTTSGTEVYHPYYNLGKSKIENLTVKEHNTVYQTLSSWDTSGSLSDKAYKCGINEITNGVELCWGISSYGSHTYVVSYTISNFVAELTDSQMIYWTFIPYDFSNSIGSVYIKLHTNFYIQDSIDIWGYGNYGGTAYAYNGYIEMQSNGALAKDEYMTMLVKFPSNTFNTTNSLNHNFDYYYEMAEDGSTKYNERSESPLTIILNIVTLLLSFSPFIIGLCVIIALILTTKASKLHFGKDGKKMSSDLPYYRDIPCNNDIFRAYYIGYNYGLLKLKTDLLGAIILKWLKDDIIRIETKESDKLFKKNNLIIYLNENEPTKLIANKKEQDLFHMLYEASKDGILENKEFEKWCNTSYSKILRWFDNILEEQRKKLIEEGLITTRKAKFLKYTIYTATPALKQEAMQLAGLKKFLKDYTLIKDREAIEVTLFEEYLIYAQMMGIAKQVAKDFKYIYPEIIEQSKFHSYDNIIIIHTYATRGISTAKTAKSQARSYSSGGGGGGSFGGGGGRRRFPLKLYIY